MVCESTDGKLTLPVKEIDYSYLNKDLFAEAHKRLLWEFRNSPNICEYLTAVFTELQLVFDAAIDVLDKRQLAKAEGEQLDVIGRIVGQDRIVVAAGEGLFGFDEDATALGYAELIDGQEVGGGRYLELGEPETGTRALADPEYRNFIVAKIFRNHMTVANECELSFIANLVLSSVTKTQVVTVAPAVIEYFFVAPGGMSDNDIALITSVIDDSRADRQRIITAGAGIQIESYSQQTGDTVFGFDDDPDPAVGGYAELTADEILFGYDDSPTPKGWFGEGTEIDGDGIYSDWPNSAENLTTSLDETGAGDYAEIIAQG